MPNGVNKGVRALAKEAGVSPALVTRKLNQGKDADRIIAEAAERREKQPDESYAAAQTRKEIATANLKEVELAQKRGELIDANETRTAWAEMISQAKSALLNIGDELGDLLAAEPSPISCREMVNEKVRQALTVLAA